ncbi:hypothetical protein CARUB_v10021251mg [Capsella rubella]|uniref:Uncharacterized protein n=1 Tax=Capsella rubella TaxID=81985 RepID=R0GJD4_9BRAS|nr:hypothetical protein CARUB_v10021251mg [Capsella rubella]
MYIIILCMLCIFQILCNLYSKVLCFFYLTQRVIKISYFSPLMEHSEQSGMKCVCVYSTIFVPRMVDFFSFPN